MEDAPGVEDGTALGDDAVGDGEGGAVEVAEGEGEVAQGGGGGEEFGEFPGLGDAVTGVGVFLVA